MGKGDKEDKKTDKKSAKGGKQSGSKACSKGGIFMGGTIGITPKPDRNNYHNVVVSRDGTPGQSQPCRPHGPPVGNRPVIICPPNNYPPPSCPNQPRRRCC